MFTTFKLNSVLRLETSAFEFRRAVLPWSQKFFFISASRLSRSSKENLSDQGMAVRDVKLRSRLSKNIHLSRDF